MPVNGLSTKKTPDQRGKSVVLLVYTDRMDSAPPPREAYSPHHLRIYQLVAQRGFHRVRLVCGDIVSLSSHVMCLS